MDIDALVLLSFGGPEAPEHVIPFLENVIRGRGVPPERLEEVAQHYMHFGGVSPITRINRELIEQIRGELAARGDNLPLYFGNRNWKPFIEDTVATMYSDGIRCAAVFPTSAWGGYSSCAQYHEDIARARATTSDDAPQLVKLRQFFDHPSFVRIFADAIVNARTQLPESLRSEARLIFTAHSIPLRAADRCGPQLYSRQVAYAAQLVAAAAGFGDYDQVWQSRSGPPQVRWLEPDVSDHLESLVKSGTKAVIICPIGFVSDHIEVIWDLDTELQSRAADLGIAMVRTATPNASPAFAGLVLDLLDELRYGREPARVIGAQPVPGYGSSINGAFCTAQCVASAANSATLTAK